MSVVGALAGFALVSGVVAAPAGSETDRMAGTLTLNASLSLASKIDACEPPSGAERCAVRTIQGRFPGLGTVDGRYEFYVDQGPPMCSGTEGKALANPIRLAVAGKGEIRIAVAEAECVPVDSIRTQTQAFVVTGGTGIYAGASGTGTLERQLGSETPSGRLGVERWRGTLAVPGLEFDVTPPTIRGAATRTVRAPLGSTRVRVTYGVTAKDAVEGSVPVSCRPRSGSRFAIGRTTVACSASDTSGNTATARFRITVRRR